MRNPVIVALDVDDSKLAFQLVNKLQGVVGGFKVGPRLSFRSDRGFLKDLKSSGIVFFDHKFFDIPSTTAASVSVAAEMGADWVTVHALNGERCLHELAKVEADIKKHNSQFKVLAVTVLTSFDKESLPPVWGAHSIEKSVELLANSTHKSGLAGFVCSPFEAKLIKNKFKDSFIVTPGVRTSKDGTQDQIRVATANEALSWGASALVIGRPIIAAKDPVLAVKEILESL